MIDRDTLAAVLVTTLVGTCVGVVVQYALSQDRGTPYKCRSFECQSAMALESAAQAEWQQVYWLKKIAEREQ